MTVQHGATVEWGTGSDRQIETDVDIGGDNIIVLARLEVAVCVLKRLYVVDMQMEWVILRR